MTSTTLVELGAVASVAIAVGVAMWRARVARSAGDLERGESDARASVLEADSRLADDVVHALSDLLTAIIGHAELLIAGLDPGGPSMRDAHAIRLAALSAAQLTKPLRSLSSGLRAPTDVIDVNAVITRTIAFLKPMLGPMIDVVLTLDRDIKRIKVGASHLDEIVLGLCLRAGEAMPNGGHLSIATTMHTHDGRDPAALRGEYVRIVIANTSGQMPPASQPGRFQPSLAGEDTDGNAAGLAKVDAIVKHAGGRIRVDSVPGGGTTITIDVPATSQPAPAADRTPAEKRFTAPVLVVEDEPGMREFIRLVLVRAGHEVVSVAGARAALAALVRQPTIALMIVDVVMPEMDGYEVVTEARKISAGIHVVFTSAFAIDPARQPIGDGFLAKPFTSESLTGIVEKAFA